MSKKNTSPKTNNKKDTKPTKPGGLWHGVLTHMMDGEGDKKYDIWRFSIGAIILILSLFMLVSFISHLFTGGQDQMLIADSTQHANNWLGKIGWKCAKWMMDDLFGLSSFFIPIFMAACSLNIMKATHLPLWKWFLHCAIPMVWLSCFGALVLSGLFEGTYISPGGQHGMNVVNFLKSHIEVFGAYATLVITLLAYMCYVSHRTIDIIRKCLNPTPLVEKIKEWHENQKGEETEETTKTNDEEIPEYGFTTQEEEEEETFTETEENERLDEPITLILPPNEEEPVPTSTATTIEFGPLGTTADQTELEFPDEMGGTQDLTIDMPIETAPEDQPIETMGMKVTLGDNEAKASEEGIGALEPYDPKLDLEHYKYPTLQLLQHYEVDKREIDMEEQQKNKNQILQALSNFGVEISSIKATVGPTITLYEIVPAPGIRITKIRNLEDDIALSLSALGIRIIAPIPGKGTVGIEVPNAKPKMVSMESIINSKKFKDTDFELPMALGKTITNEVFMVDLAKMPHLLVAGATGQGKSVGLNAIITSLLYKKHPAELKLVMVDPKKVEFSVYNPIVNHFLAQVDGNEDNEEPIITDTNKVVQTLKSLCIEMDTRYDLLKKARARNVKEYNQKFKDRHLNPENGHKFMPYIVVIIDEFGDLIMTAGKEIELPIARIAQLARAVGIHMIIATQRPTTNIITGTIKANFPARMAFKVASVVDSRTILDRTGANQLVGKGDMLFLSGNEPIRVQCAFVDTPEVENITSFIACQQSYNAPFPLPEVPMDGEDDGGAKDVDLGHLDPMFEEVARLVVTQNSGSTSMIQRKFSIGYNRAGRLMDQLEKAGVVGPAHGSKPREVLCVSEDQLQMILSSLR